jgi:hypothetical protein
VSRVTYGYDALNRLDYRQDNSSTTYFTFDGNSNNPAATLNEANQVQQAFIDLPGGVEVTVPSSGASTWS